LLCQNKQPCQNKQVEARIKRQLTGTAYHVVSMQTDGVNGQTSSA
jgi:hypothetical protein